MFSAIIGSGYDWIQKESAAVPSHQTSHQLHGCQTVTSIMGLRCPIMEPVMPLSVCVSVFVCVWAGRATTVVLATFLVVFCSYIQRKHTMFVSCCFCQEICILYNIGITRWPRRHFFSVWFHLKILFFSFAPLFSKTMHLERLLWNIYQDMSLLRRNTGLKMILNSDQVFWHLFF